MAFCRKHFKSEFDVVLTAMAAGLKEEEIEIEAKKIYRSWNIQLLFTKKFLNYFLKTGGSSPNYYVLGQIR